jgi:hypothetical protein
VVAALAALSDRELLLVQEAALVGYNLGYVHYHEEAFPSPAEIVRRVTDICVSMPQRYPVLSGRLP